MNANEARATADIAVKTKIELQSIIDMIIKAANNGDYHIMIPHIYNVRIQNSIRQLGYYLAEDRHCPQKDKIEW